MAALYQSDRKCPECDGAGSIFIPDGPGACADGVDANCPNPDCVRGSLKSWADGYAEAPRWPVKRADPLVEMASNRPHYLIQRRTPWGADHHPYRAYRRNAMKFVDLPSDDAHRMPSAETAAHFNAMTRAAA